MLSSGKVFKMAAYNNSKELELFCSDEQHISKFEIDFLGEVYGLHDGIIYKCSSSRWVRVECDKLARAMSFKGKEKFIRGDTDRWHKLDLTGIIISSRFLNYRYLLPF